MFTHLNIHEHTWTYADRNTSRLINHILIDRRRHLSILDVPSFRELTDTGHFLVFPKVRERFAVSTQPTQTFVME
jgi:hypothetical protein